jgi:hypothetical protein
MVGMRYEFNRPPVSPPSGNAAHMTVTNAARNRAGAYSEVSTTWSRWPKRLRP